jgi:hypothetical protein
MLRLKLNIFRARCAKLLLKAIEPSSRYAFQPLGPVLDRLAQLPVSGYLIIKAKAFNKLVYNKAKHDWNIAEDGHSFDADDAVMAYFAAKLGKQLLEVKSIKIPMEEVQR